MLHRGSQDYMRFSYSCTVLQYHSAAAQVEKEALSSSRVLVVYLGGKEHSVVLQRTLARFLSSDLSFRGWVQAELSLEVFCSQSLGTANALGVVPSQPHPHNNVPRLTTSFRNDVPAGTLRKTRLGEHEIHF